TMLSSVCRRSLTPPFPPHLQNHRLTPPLFFLHPGDDPLRKIAELATLQHPPLNEPVNLLRRDPGVLLDLIQDLKGDFTASGSSRHDRMLSPVRTPGNSAVRPQAGAVASAKRG